ncbi:MAG: MFS transporter [Pseudomonadota bacterium]
MNLPPPAQRAALLKERRLAFGLLLAAVTCLGMGQTVTFAILPPIGRELGLSERQVGGIFSVSALLWVLFSPYWGRLSDRWGRKPIILIGMLGYIVSTTAFTGAIAYGLAGTASLGLVYLLMVVTRSIYGMIGPGVRVASQAYIVDRTSLADRTVAIAGLSAAFGFGNVIGPGLGAAFSVFGLLAPLWAIVVLVIIVGLAIVFALPENSEPDKQTASSRLPMNDKRVRPFLVYGLAVSFAVATPMQASAFYFIDVLGFSATDAAQYVGVGLSAAALAALFSQLFVVQKFRPSPATMMIAGAALVGIAQLSIAASTTFAPMVFALMLNGFGAGLAMPGYSAGASLAVGGHEQGAVAGLTGAMGAAGFSIVPLINFSLYQVAPQLPFLFDAGLMALLLLYTWFTPKLRQANHAVGTMDPGSESGYSN